MENQRRITKPPRLHAQPQFSYHRLILELSTPELSRTESKGAAGSNRFSALRDAPRHTRARGTGRRTSGNARKTASLRFVRRVRVPSTTANCLWEVATWVARVGIGTGYLRGCVARDELPRGPRVAGGRGVEQCRGDGTGERLHRGIVSGQRGRLPRQDHQGEDTPASPTSAPPIARASFR